MSEDPTRPIRPGEYGSPGGYDASPDYGSPGGYDSPRDYGRPSGYSSPRENDTTPEYGRPGGYGADGGFRRPEGYGRDGGYGPDGGYGRDGGYGADRGYRGPDGYGASSGTARLPDGGDGGRRAGRAGGTGRRRHRGLTITAIVVVVLAILLVVADRVAAGIAENQVASQIKSAGFPVKPKVTIDGFPFLTQLAARDFHQMDIAASNVTEGPLEIANVNATMHGVHINSSFNGATVDQINGTALITFAGLSRAGGLGDGITLSNGGNGEVKASIDLGFVSGTALAQVTRTGPHQIGVRVVSAGGLPLSVLGPLQDFSVNLPNLPAGMTIQSVSVTGQGLLLTIAGTHTTFSQ
jgi:LmeA-like phospholipid-binding